MRGGRGRRRRWLSLRPEQIVSAPSTSTSTGVDEPVQLTFQHVATRERQTSAAAERHVGKRPPRCDPCLKGQERVLAGERQPCGVKTIYWQI